MIRPLITDISGNIDKTLTITYDNGEIKVFDAKPYIIGSWFGELSDADYFRSVHIINGGRGIEWAHGQDIAPHELYELSVVQKSPLC